MNISGKEIESFSFSRDGFPSFGVKSPIIWGHAGNAMFPLCYLHKPKHLSSEDWSKFLDSLSMYISVKY